LTTEKPDARRAALLVVTSDRGLAGGYSAFVLRTAESYIARLRDEGKETKLYVIGRKGGAYFRFRNRPVEELWTGFTDSPSYDDAKVAADTLIDAFRTGTDDGGVDEIHIVFTEFVSSVTQRPAVSRILPLVVEQKDYDPATEKLPFPLYEFEQPHLQCAAAARRFRARRPPARDEVRDRQRGRPHQGPGAQGQLGPPGRDHARNHGDRRRRGSAVQSWRI